MSRNLNAKQRATKTGFELKAVLDQEVTLIGSLLDVMRQEQEMLMLSDTGRLVEMTKSKELLILQHSYLEQTRRSLTQRLAVELGLRNSEPKLATLIDALDGKLAAMLTDLRTTLKALIEEIEHLSSENRELIQCSIRAVRDSWALLKRQFVATSNYTDGVPVKILASGQALLQGRI